MTNPTQPDAGEFDGIPTAELQRRRRELIRNCEWPSWPAAGYDLKGVMTRNAERRKQAEAIDAEVVKRLTTRKETKDNE